MEQRDRAVRGELVTRGELHRPGYHPEMAAVHEEHNRRMRAIVAEVGWPGRSLVGDDGCRAAGFIVQHAILDPGLQQECVALLEAAVAADEAWPFMLALLADRVRVEQGRPQLYGTQLVGGAVPGSLEPWPIEDPAAVDQRRQAVGLPPLAEHIARLTNQHREETAK